MKITYAFWVAILVAIASAAPLPEPDGRIPCGRVGEPCIKRDAAPVPEPVAIPEPEPEADGRIPCGRVGEDCIKAKRDLEAPA